jgi:6-phosphogluconolactonase
MSYSIESFASRDTLDLALCERVEGILQAGIEHRGRAFCVISGGSTPIGFFRSLTKADLDFSKVTFILADERWVSSDHPDSNEGAVRHHLLQGPVRLAKLVGLFREGLDINANAVSADRIIQALPVFDAVILGMGLDGHTASLFPSAAGIEAALDLEGLNSVVAIQPLSAPNTRLSLSAQRLIKTENLILHLTSAEKLAVLKEAEACQDAALMPVSRFLNQSKVAMQVVWAP